MRRHAISGLVAAIVGVSAGAAQACGGGLFQRACSPCGWGYVSPCAPRYVYASPAPVYYCQIGCSVYERLPDPAPYHYSNEVHQYYYVNQGPTYTGPGDFAPYPYYEESAIFGWEYLSRRPYGRRYHGYRHFRHYGTAHGRSMAQD